MGSGLEAVCSGARSVCIRHAGWLIKRIDEKGRTRNRCAALIAVPDLVRLFCRRHQSFLLMPLLRCWGRSDLRQAWILPELAEFFVLVHIDEVAVTVVFGFLQARQALLQVAALIHLNFSSVKGDRAMVSAIEVLPGMRGQVRPVRIVARDVPIIPTTVAGGVPTCTSRTDNCGPRKRPPPEARIRNSTQPLGKTMVEERSDKLLKETL